MVVDQAEKILGYGMKFGNMRVVKNALAYAGKPIGLDIREYESSDKTKDPSWAYYPHRYGATWGNIVGVLGFGVSLLLGKLPQNSDQPNAMLGTARFVSGLVGFAGIGGSLWSSISGATYKKFVGEKEALIKAGAQIFKDVNQELPNGPLKEKLINSPLRFNDVVNERIKGVDVSKGVKQFFTGPSGTGKTEGIDFISARIVEHEETRHLNEGEVRRQVKVIRLKGKELNQAISLSHKNTSERNELISEFLQLSGVNTSNTDEVKAALQKSKTELLEGFLKGLEKEFQKAKDSNTRLVVQLDEIDELFAVARQGGADGKYDEEFLAEVSGVLGNLLDSNSNNYDILCTSNRGVKELCGVGSNYESVEKLRGTNMEKVYDRLKQMSQEVNPPEDYIKGQICHVYLKEYLSDPLMQDTSETGNKSTSIANLISMDEQKAGEEIIKSFNNEYGLAMVPDITTDLGIQEFKKVIGSGSVRTSSELEAFKQKIILKLKFRQLSGRDIMNIFSQDLSNQYNATRSKIGLKEVLIKIYSKVVGSGSEGTDGCDLTKAQIDVLNRLFIPLEKKFEDIHLNELDQTVSRGNAADKRRKAQKNIEVLQRYSKNYADLLHASTSLSESDYQAVSSHDKSESIFDELKSFVSKYCNDDSAELASLDFEGLSQEQFANDSRIRKINLDAAIILGRINQARKLTQVA